MISNVAEECAILPMLDFTPFATAEDRGAWEGLSPDLRTQLVAAGEEFLGFEWPLVRATDYLEYVESGDRSRHAQRYFDRRFAIGNLAIAECVEGKGRFLRDLVDGLWLVCEETSWVIPAHEGEASRYAGPLPSWHVPDQGIDLFAAETGALLSWTRYLLGGPLEKLFPAVYDRVADEVKARIIRQFEDRTDLWWMGLEPSYHGYLNNWTPWCVTNCLAAILLVEADDERRRSAVAKAAGCLDRYLDQQPKDGGCDEGPGYWMAAAGALCDALELIKLATDGSADAFGEPLVREMAGYLRRVHIRGDWFVNFGDGGARLSPPPELLFRYGKRIGDNQLLNLGLSYLANNPEPARWYPVFRQLSYLFSHEQMSSQKDALAAGTAQPAAPQASPYDTLDGNRRITWLPNSEIFVCAGKELFLTAKGAHNGESHNHNDVGQFVIFAGDDPFVVDAGVAEYTRKTFSSERYDIWTMQSAYHNLPRVAGRDQLPGKEYQAENCRVRQDGDSHVFELELQSAYPRETGLKRWQRTLTHHQAPSGVETIRLSDTYDFEKAGAEIALHIMTPWEPRKEERGCATAIVLEAPSGRALTFGLPSDLTVRWEPVVFDDSRLAVAWGTRLYRVVLLGRARDSSGGWELAFTLDSAEG
jgi:hypothetical protein